MVIRNLGFLIFYLARLLDNMGCCVHSLITDYYTEVLDFLANQASKKMLYINISFYLSFFMCFLSPNNQTRPVVEDNLIWLIFRMFTDWKAYWFWLLSSQFLAIWTWAGVQHQAENGLRKFTCINGSQLERSLAMKPWRLVDCRTESCQAEANFRMTPETNKTCMISCPSNL